MNSKQKEQTEKYITELDKTIAEFYESNDPSELYDICETVYAIYRAEIDGLDDQHEILRNYSGLVGRCAKAISALLKNYIISNYISVESELVNNTRYCLSCCAQSLEKYDEALEKYSKNIYQRNTLDDMRLSLELLLKYVLKNDKSLENQRELLGAQLKEVGASNEIRNTFNKILDYYCKYQNEHVKHSDLIDANEIEIIIELTSVLIKFVVKMLVQEEEANA